MVRDLPDVQKSVEGFAKIPIQKVGVRNIKVPMLIKAKNGKDVKTFVSVSSYCNLVESIKGINMSRISRTLLDCLSESSDGIKDLSSFAYKLQKAHQTDNIYVKARFQYTIDKQSPVTKINFQEPVEVTFESILLGNVCNNYLTVRQAGMSLCPCSKEMSLLQNNITSAELDQIRNLPKDLSSKILETGLGAHNQLSIVEAKVQLTATEDKLWIEDIISLIDSCFSSPVFSVLKREDEKWVTEQSYKNPKFVEDIARDVAAKLNVYLDKSISDYVVVCNNQESIHNEMLATAVLSAGRILK